MRGRVCENGKVAKRVKSPEPSTWRAIEQCLCSLTACELYSSVPWEDKEQERDAVIPMGWVLRW